MRHHRYLEPFINDICFKANKMALVSGPRQCGKTTMAKMLLQKRGAGAYYNWDEIKFRRLWVQDPMLVIPEQQGKIKPLIILDELHKAKYWKRNLKGLYDSQDDRCDILVTGSARLNIYRKGSDSLLGRYYHFRLHPFSFSELLNEQYYVEPIKLIQDLFTKMPPTNEKLCMLTKQLLEFGPFPEPLFAQNKRTLNLWSRGRIEKIIREDLRDLSRLPELSQVEMLASLLPTRASQPLSIQSLSEDIEVAYTTIKRWINYLKELYYIYTLQPYSRTLTRAIKKENKLYLWDWSEIENPGARFENMIASHLLKYCNFLVDTGIDSYELQYLKNKEKREIDFLITKKNKPFLPIEVKLADEQPDPAWHIFMKQVKCQYGIQVILKPDVYKIYDLTDYKILVISSEKFLQFLV